MFNDGTATSPHLLGSVPSKQLASVERNTTDAHPFALEWSSFIGSAENLSALDQAEKAIAFPIAHTLIAAGNEPGQKGLRHVVPTTPSSPQMTFEASFGLNTTDAINRNDLASADQPTEIAQSVGKTTVNLGKLSESERSKINIETPRPATGTKGGEALLKTETHSVMAKTSNAPHNAKPAGIENLSSEATKADQKLFIVQTTNEAKEKTNTISVAGAAPFDEAEAPTRPQLPTKQAAPQVEIQSFIVSVSTKAEKAITSNSSVADMALSMSATPLSPPPAQTTSSISTTMPAILQQHSALAQSAVTLSALPDTVAELITSTDEATDRVIVKLDPPELGRVSVDFKFDSLGLQTVIVAAETPEALRKLRSMHHELIQVLEQNGLSEKNASSSSYGGRQHAQQNFIFQELSTYKAEVNAIDKDALHWRESSSITHKNIKTPITNGLNLKL